MSAPILAGFSPPAGDWHRPSAPSRAVATARFAGPWGTPPGRTARGRAGTGIMVAFVMSVALWSLILALVF